MRQRLGRLGRRVLNRGESLVVVDQRLVDVLDLLQPEEETQLVSGDYNRPQARFTCPQACSRLGPRHRRWAKRGLECPS